MRNSPFLLALLLVGCSNGGSGPSPPVQHVPAISNLTLSPSSVAYSAGDGEVAVTVDLSFRDSGKDIATLWIEMPDGARVPFAEPSGAPTGTVSEKITMSTKAVGTFTVEAWLVDKAGDGSNHLSANLAVVGDTPVSQWTKRLGDLPFALNDVAWTGREFVAVGSGGKILTSTTGIDWTERSSSTVDELIAVASRGSDIVAVGDAATVLLSSDGGATWTTRHTGAPVRLAAVTISPSQIVTGGIDQEGNAFMMRSLDRGATWRVVETLPQTRHFIVELIHANGLFVAGTDVFSWESDTRVMVSTDGEAWSDIVLADDAIALYALAHDGRQFIAAGSDAAVFVSPDGYNWTKLQTPVDRIDYASAAWNGTRLLVAGGIPWWYWWVGPPSFERPVGLSSTDGGVSWEIFNIDGHFQSRGLAWGNGGRFVSVGQTTPDSGRGAIYTSG